MRREQAVKPRPVVADATARRRAAAGLLLLAAWTWIGAARAEESPAELRQRIQSMSPAEKEQLRQREERFHSLGPAEQQRILKLHEDLEQAPDGPQLRQVMHRYYEWLKTLPSYRRAELLTKDPKERVQRIQELREEQAKIDARRLNPKDAEELLKWMEEYAKKQEPRFLGTLLPEDRERFERESDPKSRSRALMWWYWQRSQMGSPVRMPPLADADLADLRSKLSPETRKRIEDLPLDEQRRTVASWIYHERRNHWRRTPGKSSPIDDEELIGFFESELSDADRDRLLSLPGDELQKELRNMYQIRHRTLEPPRPGEGPGRFRGPRPPDGEPPYFRGSEREPPEAGPGFRPRPPAGKTPPAEIPPGSPPATQHDPSAPPSATEKTPAAR